MNGELRVSNWSICILTCFRALAGRGLRLPLVQLDLVLIVADDTCGDRIHIETHATLDTAAEAGRYSSSSSGRGSIKGAATEQRHNRDMGRKNKSVELIGLKHKGDKCMHSECNIVAPTRAALSEILLPSHCQYAQYTQEKDCFNCCSVTVLKSVNLNVYVQ